MAVRKAVIYRELANIINNGNLNNGERYLLIEPEPGSRQVLEKLPNKTVRYIRSAAVINSILRFSAENQQGAYEDLTPHDATEAVKYWMGISPVREMPKYLADQFDTDLCFHRLNFSYHQPPGETLVIDEFLSRCTNAEAIRQFVGSLTVENSSRYQYLWIYGSGGEGKGSFGRGLMNIFGPGAITMAVPRTDGQKQFLAYTLRGKRLCLFPECSNFAFPNDPLFKQFTGGDHVFLEPKGKMGVSGTLNCKFMFFSNERAGVHGTDANTRRLIYSEVSKPTIKYSANTYDALIYAEMPSFIIKCRNLYIEKCPQGEDILFEDDATRELLDQNEEQFQVLTERWFIKDANGSVTPAQMQYIKSVCKLSTTEYRHWIEYMRTKLGIVSIVQRWAGEQNKSRRWVGIRDKPFDTNLTRGVT